MYSHPFSHYGSSRVVFLAHNGSLKGQYPGKVDSEVALEIVSSNDGDLAKAEYELKLRMMSAINMLVLSFEKEKPLEATLKYLNFWNRDEEEERFYQMYTAKMPNGNAVMSSTIAFRLDVDGTAPSDILPRINSWGSFRNRFLLHGVATRRPPFESSAAVALSTGVNSGMPFPTFIIPVFRMLIAAFTSRSIVRPQALQ